MTSPQRSRTDDVQRSGLPAPLRPLAVVVAMAAVMWIVEIVDLFPGTDLDRWGIRPRQLRGLLGIVAAPFLHSGFPHLIANTIPFVVLGCAIALGGIERFAEVTLTVALISGMGTWILGASDSVHIGASGLVFGYVTYLVARGVFARKPLWLLGGLLVLVAYGGILWGLLPRPGISWTGHLFGAIGGVIAARVMHGSDPDTDATKAPALS